MYGSLWMWPCSLKSRRSVAASTCSRIYCLEAYVSLEASFPRFCHALEAGHCMHAVIRKECCGPGRARGYIAFTSQHPWRPACMLSTLEVALDPWPCNRTCVKSGRSVAVHAVLEILRAARTLLEACMLQSSKYLGNWACIHAGVNRHGPARGHTAADRKSLDCEDQVCDRCHSLSRAPPMAPAALGINNQKLVRA